MVTKYCGIEIHHLPDQNYKVNEKIFNSMFDAMTYVSEIQTEFIADYNK